MNSGMLWFDNDPKTPLPEKINQAADYYKRKYGKQPNLCVVNPRMLAQEKAAGGRIEIQASAAILPNHLWIGVDSKPN